MKKTWKKAVSALLTLAMVLSVAPVTALAEETETITGSSAILTFDADKTVTLKDVTITAGENESAISIEKGNVTLIVEGENTLTGGDNGAGIYVAEGASVTIKGEGKLTAIGNAGKDDERGAAGIGGTWENGNSGAITIDGATVIAKGYGVHGSGIGSGSGEVAGKIEIINAADVTAYGGYYAYGDGTKLQSDYGKNDPEGGAAIGGGGKTSSAIADIKIEDSTVVAYGGSKAAGIGANFWSSCGTITIEDSTVTAQGGSSSAGIGTSREGDDGVTANIKIIDSTVNATGGDYGAGIGRGYNNNSLGNGTEEPVLPKMYVTIEGGEITATGGQGGAAIGGGYKGNNVVIEITDDAEVTAKAGELVTGKEVTTGGAPCAIGSGANGSGTFVGSEVTIENLDKVKVEAYAAGKPAIEGLAVAKIGNDKFETLAAAVEAAKSGDTITLLMDAEGSGIVIDKDITIDFGTYTYTFTTPGVGSGEFKSNGFQILKEAGEVTLKNGKLEVADDNADEYYILIQNYADLTVEDMILDGKNLDKYAKSENPADGDSYTLSNNNGNVVITGETTIIANNDGDKAFAFDVYDKPGYNGVTVTFDKNFEGEVKGNFEVDSTEGAKAELVIYAGTFTMKIEDAWCAKNYAPVNNGDGTWTVGTSTDEPAPSTSSSKKSKKYDVIIKSSDNGDVTVDDDYAKRGQEITITVDPDKGYELDELTITDQNGDEVDYDEGKKENTFVFDMPKSDVTIEASFDKASSSAVDKDDEDKEDKEDVSDKEEDTSKDDEQKYIRLTIGQKIVWLFDEYVVNDVAPEIRNDRTMLPIRIIAEALGATVTWNETEQKVTITEDDLVIEIFIDQPFATVNGEPVKLDAPAYIENDRTYLPLRFVAENLGATVVWNDTDNTVTIYE